MRFKDGKYSMKWTWASGDTITHSFLDEVRLLQFSISVFLISQKELHHDSCKLKNLAYTFLMSLQFVLIFRQRSLLMKELELVSVISEILSIHSP